MRAFHAFCVGAALFASSAAHADYLGLSVERHTTVNIAGITRDVYRVYADFSNPGDQLTFLAGSPTLGAMTLQSRNSNDTGPGGNFVNVPGGGNQAPSQEVIDVLPDVQWDSFYTIGISIAEQAPYGDQINFPPGSPPSLAGNSATTSNGGWACVPTIDHDGSPDTPPILSPQGVAGFLGDGDPLLRVMFLQLTVNAGNHVRGTLAVGGRIAIGGPLAGGLTFGFGQQTFSSFPSPGGVAVMVLSGIACGRRRRR